MPRLFDLSTATGPPNSTDPSWCGSTRWRPLTPMSNPVSIATALASSSAIGRDLGPFPPSSQESQASAPGMTDARMKQVRLNIARPLVEAHQRHRARQRKEKLREQSPKPPPMSTVASAKIPPSPNVTEKLARSVSMFHSALAFQPQSPEHSETQISTGLPSQQCSRNDTNLSGGEDYTSKGGSISDDTEGKDDGL
jgi:hypothetical protein